MIHAADSDRFYVGYRPVPGRLKGPLFGLVAACAVGLVALSGVIAGAQRDPGTGVWATDLTTIRGVLIADPYATVIPEDGSGPLLVVEMGKLGGGSRAEEHAGRLVALSGYRIERAGRRMIELDAGEEAVALLDEAPPPLASSAPSMREDAPVTLEGEIVDSKCFLGVMKPGDRATHRACATLCIEGGIPPMLVTRDARGQSHTVLLVDESGGQLTDRIAPYVGVPVRLTGRRGMRGGWEVLYVDVSGIRLR